MTDTHVPFEPPLTLAFVEKAVAEMRKELHAALASIPDDISNYSIRQRVIVAFQAKGYTLQGTVLYMMAWHRIEGDVVAIARALGKLAEA